MRTACGWPWLVIFVYLLSLPVAHLRDAPRRQLVVTGIVQGYIKKLLRAPPGSFTYSAYSTITLDLGLTSYRKDKWMALHSCMSLYSENYLNMVITMSKMCRVIFPYLLLVSLFMINYQLSLT